MPAAAVILNADDLGLWPSVTEGILAAWRVGAISDSSVFANAPDLPAVLAAAAAAGLPVGLHLNLTVGRPLSDADDLPGLLTPDGCFMKRRQWELPLSPMAIRRELTTQLERFLSLGHPPSHLDSHHHVQAYPEVLAVVVDLARAHDLPVRAVTAEMREALRQAGIRTPDHFSMAFYGERATEETLITLVETCPGGTLEIMAHPGLDTPGMPSSYRAERARELAILTAPGWRMHLATLGVSLIGYGALS